MTCGLDIKAYETQTHIILVADIYGAWQINKITLEETEISEEKLNTIEKTEINVRSISGWDVYPRTVICVLEISGIFLVTEYSGSEGSFHIMKITRSKEYAKRWARKVLKEYKYPYFWI